MTARLMVPNLMVPNLMVLSLATTLSACSLSSDSLRVDGPEPVEPITDVATLDVGPSTGPMVPTTYDPRVSLAPLVETLQPAVVYLEVEQDVAGMSPFDGVPPQLRQFFGDPSGGDATPRTRTGQGSGFIISADGYLLTNNHVVDGADRVTVNMSDERSFEGTVVGTDPRTDVALVRIESDEPLPFVKMGSSDGLRVGDWVVAIGNPFGLSHTVTQGIVSAKGRAIGAGPYDDFIQTDASINPGNSGGPLFNLRGEVVGINTAINARGQGIGFAVPSDMVADILDDLREHGSVERGWMGVGLQPLNAELAQALEVDADSGVVISQVYEGFPAAKGGLKAGDLVLSLDGEAVGDSEQLVRAIGERRPGDTVNMQVLRKGKERQVDVTLAARPDEQDVMSGRFRSGQPDAPEAAPKPGRLGVTLVPAPDGEGLMVEETSADGPAHGRLLPGDRVIALNHQDVRSAAQLRRALERETDVALFVVEREGAQVLVPVPMGE